jgi:transcription initiation factor IIE alpha subunit
MMNNAFANSGLSPSCPICGGVVAIMDSRRAKKDIDKSQRDRGIPVVD